MTMFIQVRFEELSRRLDVRFSEIVQRLSVEFSETTHKFDVKFGEFQTVTEYVGGDLYMGEYVATPKVDEQTMPTKDKVLIDDVTIRSIPFFDVSNTSGGSTVYIANEV